MMMGMSTSEENRTSHYGTTRTNQNIGAFADNVKPDSGSQSGSRPDLHKMSGSTRSVPTVVRSASAIFLVLLVASCSEPASRQERPWADSTVPVVLDQKGERDLLSFYVGGMVSQEGADPFAAGLVLDAGDAFRLDLDKIEEHAPSASPGFRAAAADGEIDWDEFEQVIWESYYSYRSIPATVAELKEGIGDWSDEDAWFGFGVNGVMSPTLRRIRVRTDRLLDAIRNYRENGNRIIYGTGTTFVSDHLRGAESVELSVMTKRADGYWDFYSYDGDGRLARVVKRAPTDLTVPTRCVGCHFGNRLFEPERSFPVDPPPAPDGPRRLYVSDDMRDPEVVRVLDEHRKRSDRILGLYATLFISEMKMQRATGTLSLPVEDALASAGF